MDKMYVNLIPPPNPPKKTKNQKKKKKEEMIVSISTCMNSQLLKPNFQAPPLYKMEHISLKALLAKGFIVMQTSFLFNVLIDGTNLKCKFWKKSSAHYYNLQAKEWKMQIENKVNLITYKNKKTE